MLRSFFGGLRPKRLTDPAFGNLIFMKMSDPRESYWEGSGAFRPTGQAVDYFVDAGDDGPGEFQHQFLSTLEQRYDRLVAVVQPLLEQRHDEFLEGRSPEFVLSSISVPGPGVDPLRWDITFQAKANPSALFTVSMVNWEPEGVRIDD